VDSRFFPAASRGPAAVGADGDRRHAAIPSGGENLDGGQFSTSSIQGMDEDSALGIVRTRYGAITRHPGCRILGEAWACVRDEPRRAESKSSRRFSGDPGDWPSVEPLRLTPKLGPSHLKLIMG